MHHKIYDACNVNVQKRLQEDLANLVSLPWSFNSASDLFSFVMLPTGEFLINSDILTKEQKTMLAEFARQQNYGIEEKKTRRAAISLQEKEASNDENNTEEDDDKFFTFYGLAENKGNILNRLVAAKLDAEIKADYSVLSKLKWVYTKNGDLVCNVLDSLKSLGINPVNTLTDGSIGKTSSDDNQLNLRAQEGDDEFIGTLKNITLRRGIQLSSDGDIKLSKTNTVSKLWDSKDGETNIERCILHSLVEQQIIDNAKSLFSDLKDKDWKYGVPPISDQSILDSVKRLTVAIVYPEKPCFYIEKSKLSEEQISSLLAFDGGFAAIEGEYIKIANHEIVGRNSNFKPSLRDVKDQFIDALSGRITLPQIPQGILDLPWSHLEKFVTLPASENTRLTLLATRYNIPLSTKIRGNGLDTLEISTSHWDDFYISNIAFIKAVKQNTEKKQDAFIAENADKIAALPWRVYADTDLTSQSWAIHLVKEDLNGEKKKLLEDLENLGLVRAEKSYSQGKVVEIQYLNHGCGNQLLPAELGG